jgi:hypothetical protein
MRVRGRSRWPGTVGPALTVADVVAVLLAGLLVGEPTARLALAAVAAVLVVRAADLHRPRLVLSIVEDLPALLVASAAATVVAVGSGSARATYGVLVFACLVLGRTLTYAGTHVLRRSLRLGRRVLVVGTGTTARRLAMTLLTRPELGLRPVGFVGTVGTVGTDGTDGVNLADQARGLPLSLVGPVTTLPRSMSEAGVDTVVVALSGPAGDDEAAAIEGLLATSAELYAVPAWFPRVRAYSRHPRELVGGLPVVHLYRRAARLPVRIFKRVVEVVVALVGLAALLPVFAALAVLVKVETGDVLVRHSRVGADGRSVKVPRFRTRRSRSVVRPGTTFSVAISGRVGPVGKLLRSTGLVALPDPMLALLRRVRYAGGVADSPQSGSASAPRADESEVHARQLAR